MNWLILNMKSDAEKLQKEMEKVNKSKDTSVIKATTNDTDFNDLINKHRELLKNRR